MKKPDRFKFGAAMGMAAALVFYAGTGAWAQLDTDVPGGHIKIQTALETDWGVTTAGKNNRNNNNNNIPGSGQGFSTDGNDLQAAIGRIDPLLTFRANDDIAEAMWLDNADVYLHVRFWATPCSSLMARASQEFGQGAYKTPGVRGIPATDGQPTSASMSTRLKPTRPISICARDLLRLRLGKQQVVYGEELGCRRWTRSILSTSPSSRLLRHRRAGILRHAHRGMDGQTFLPASGFLTRWESTIQLSRAGSAPTSSPPTFAALGRR